MINVLYLLKILKTNKISELVANIDAPFLDLNLAIFDAENAGEIEVNRDKDKIKALKDHEVTFDSDLANKILRTLQHYESKEINITRGRLTNFVKNPGSEFNYPYHDYLCALQYLVDSEQIIEEVVSIPKLGDRPYKKFVFLQFPGNPNEDWNRGEVNKWIANWAKKK